MQNCDQRTIEEAGVPALLLMESAGLACARVIARLLTERMDTSGDKALAAVVCGPGNNGGDGYVCARHLHMLGIGVHIIQTAKPKTDSARQMCRIAETCGLEFIETAHFRSDRYSVVVDAIFGIGLNRDLDELHTEIINQCSDAEFVVSIDIPSGIDADTGEILGHVIQADFTIALQCPKQGHFLNPGSIHSGQLIVEPIGIQLEGLPKNLPFWIPEEIPLLPPRLPWGHKGTFGHVLAIGGCSHSPGAIRLAALSSHLMGAGKTSVISNESTLQAIQIAEPELLIQPCSLKEHLSHQALKDILKHPADVLLIGPGMGRNLESLVLVQELLEKDSRPMILDADALHALPGAKEDLPRWFGRRKNPSILTPHVGELGVILGISTEETEARKFMLASELAQEWNVVLVVKSSTTLIAFPDGNLELLGSPNPTLAKGGTGDFLSGLMAALLAMEFPAEEAARQAVLILDLLGRRISETHSTYCGSVKALLEMLPQTIAELTGFDSEDSE